MILADKYENIRLFGAKVDSYFVTAKVAWVNRNASKVVQVCEFGNSSLCYTIELGSKFARKPTPALIEHIYLPRK